LEDILEALKRERLLDGTNHNNEHELIFQVLAVRPPTQTKPAFRLAINHPLRKKSVGGKQALLRTKNSYIETKSNVS
jgi:hypothetical protein